MRDRTAEAVRRQLQGMGCSRYELGIRDREGRMMSREWTPAEVEKNLPWLKRQNAQGADIYVRPAQGERHGLVLVDDVDRVTIEAMCENGHSPAVVVETSPKNCQAWIKAGEDLRPEIRSEIARSLAREYEADPNSADHRHFGRLAGFTNRKPEHLQEGRGFPYVLCHEADGRIAVRAPEIVCAAAERVEARRVEAERQRRLEAIQEAQEHTLSGFMGHDPVDFYRGEMRRLQDKYGQVDWSKADFMTAKVMAMKGYSADQVAKAVREGSPNLSGRKVGHEEDYIRRTVTGVFQDPHVQQRLQELKRQQSMRMRLTISR